MPKYTKYNVPFVSLPAYVYGYENSRAIVALPEHVKKEKKKKKIECNQLHKRPLGIA